MRLKMKKALGPELQKGAEVEVTDQAAAAQFLNAGWATEIDPPSGGDNSDPKES